MSTHKVARKRTHDDLLKVLLLNEELDDNIFDLLEENRKAFDVDFIADIRRITTVADFKNYVGGLTNLERHFLGFVRFE
tara:strand:+ start:17171 stop:17407 length:237 start_codon:yes stop_codon:yes gene_type:complete